MSTPEEELARLAAKPHAVVILEVPETMRQVLEGMRAEEVEAFASLVRMGPEGVKQLLAALKLFQSVSTVSKFIKWILIFFVGFFVAGASILDGGHKIWTFVTGGKAG